MTKTAKNILSLNHEEAMDFFMNMTYTQDKKQGTSPYTIRLCQLVAGKTVEPLWNNDWLKAEPTTNLPYDSVVDGEILKKITPLITFRETRRYNEIFIKIWHISKINIKC